MPGEHGPLCTEIKEYLSLLDWSRAINSGPLYTSDQGPGQIILLVTALSQEP
jgi:hypothetical protein